MFTQSFQNHHHVLLDVSLDMHDRCGDLPKKVKKKKREREREREDYYCIQCYNKPICSSAVTARYSERSLVNRFVIPKVKTG